MCSSDLAVAQLAERERIPFVAALGRPEDALSISDQSVRVARMAGTMHRAGVNHRDFYICHFLLHTDRPVTADDLHLSLIDLHRAQVRSAVPLRWRNKDLAALYFSALDIGLTRRDKLRFLRTYFQRPLRDVLREEASLLAWLERKAAKLYERKQRYGDAL